MENDRKISREHTQGEAGSKTIRLAIQKRRAMGDHHQDVELIGAGPAWLWVLTSCRCDDSTYSMKAQGMLFRKSFKNKTLK